VTSLPTSQRGRIFSRRSLLAGAGAAILGVLGACVTQGVVPGLRGSTGEALPAQPHVPPEIVSVPAPIATLAPRAELMPTPTADVQRAKPPALLPVAATRVPTIAAPGATVTVALPTPTANVAIYDEFRLRDRLGAAQTSYAGSIPERAHNVELAAKRLDGARIAPGEVFSFNNAVGSTTLLTGYKKGYGITMKDDRPETIPSVAGGICQIATTVFQAAFWAGLPFVERYSHIYWIPRYGVPPSGRLGYDATVDDPGVDLKFRNTTGDWIRLSSWFDGANVGFVLHGVNPRWKVEAAPPTARDTVKTDTKMVFQDDPTMPVGRQLEVEHAEDGFTLTGYRTVSQDGKIVDQYVFTNRYRPARNVTLVGTLGATPTPSPVPTATPTPLPGLVGRMPNGRVIVPPLSGMSEAHARAVIAQIELTATYTNYQGPSEVPPYILASVPVGHVLSHQPPPGSEVFSGTPIHLAVRAR